MTNLKKLLGLFLIWAISLELVASNHLPGHRSDYAEPEALTLNERFFNDVRALIKRRLKENAAVSESEHMSYLAYLQLNIV